MINLWILGVTALVVSLDSFVAGFSLSLNKKPNLVLPTSVALITLLLCLSTSFLGMIVSKYVDEQYISYFGAGLLAALGVITLVKRDEQRVNLRRVTFAESITIGFAVGTDAAIANLSLSISNASLVAPLVFAVTHYITVLLGQLLAQKITIGHSNVFSAVVLFILAATKFVM